jgi:hypothetical protein
MPISIYIFNAALSSAVKLFLKSASFFSPLPVMVVFPTGGFIPIPRKLSHASASIINPSYDLIMTMMRVKVLGKL